jgi:hypothetical protein
MLAPDHWIPITVASYRKSLTRFRTYLFASGIGLAHGVSSAALSLAIVQVGSFFFPEYYVNLFAVLLLVVIALYVIVSAALEAKSGERAESVSVLVSVIPDPALVPFILIAQGFGVAFALVMVGAFVFAAVASVTVVVYLATMGLSAALSRIRAEYVDFIVALALLLTAAFVYLYG